MDNLGGAIIDGRHPAPTPPVAAVAFAWLRFETLAVFLYIETKSIQVARGQATGLCVTFLPVFLVVTLATTWVLVQASPR